MSQLSVSTTPYLQCVAVSTTLDATGTWNRYSFQYSNFDDYPKMGVWPDAYYETFNMFSVDIYGDYTFVGADACAYNRTAMLAGQSATQICFQQNPSVGGLLPSDLDGTTAPPAGSPNYMLYFGTNSLNLYKFHVDFNTPANSTFTGPTVISVAPFSPLCGGGTCVPQPGTSNTVASLADRLMNRLAYRKFGSHESLVVNHSVAVSGGGGVRWYEIQNPLGTPPILAQQGTFAPPDLTYRWMGSVAMDQVGDLAVGYSKSSSLVYPSIAFAGRVPTDPAGTLETETDVVDGSGSQTGTLHRWGDYSAMTVDPTDDCTFWYTQEYIKTNGTFNWNTRITSFKFPGCPSSGGGSVTLTPNSLNFGNQTVGQPSPPQAVTLTNNQSVPLSSIMISTSGDYSQTNNCGMSVPANGSCIINVVFTPTITGTRTGTLTVTDNGPGSPQTASLTGVGIYALSVSIGGSGMVTSTDGYINCPGTCSHSYLGNSQVTLNATPAQGWTFSGWSGACSGTGSCVVTMTQNLSVSATFTQLYTLTVSTIGSGTVTSTDGFINCPGTCSHSYLGNSQVTLNATPAQGWTFSGWSGACSGTGSCVVTMTQNLSVSATFTQLYTLTVSTIGSGTVTSTDGFINCPGTCSHSYLGNSQVTLNATPAQGWTFSGWSGACSGTGSCVVTMTQNLSVSATFTQLYTLTVSTIGSGTVTSTDGFINCPGTCSHSYLGNSQVTLNATPAQGWTFSGWSGACSGTGSCVVTMTQNLSVSATFTQLYTLTVSTIGSGTVTSTDGFINCPGTCSHSYLGNSQVTLNATPAQGWTFSGWSGACSGTGSCVVTMTQNLSVSATFTQLYTLTVSTIGSGTVTSTDGFINCPGTCSHSYLSNTQVTLNA